MPKRQTNDLGELSKQLGHDFSKPALLKLALTHASARANSKPNEDNERLEFLGDRVLGLAVAELLSVRFPDAYEGELARWFNHLVRSETCAAVVQRAMAAESMAAARRTPLIAAFPKMLFPIIVILPGMIAMALTTNGGGFSLPLKPDGSYNYDMAIPLMLVFGAPVSLAR